MERAHQVPQFHPRSSLRSCKKIFRFMAKLKAHGAELGRATLERQTPKSELTQWVREERTLMADGKLMEKRTVRFKPSTFDATGRLHNHGWKLRGKAKPGLTVERWAQLHRSSGWTVEIFVPSTSSLAQAA